VSNLKAFLIPHSGRVSPVPSRSRLSRWLLQRSSSRELIHIYVPTVTPFTRVNWKLNSRRFCPIVPDPSKPDQCSWKKGPGEDYCDGPGITDISLKRQTFSYDISYYDCYTVPGQ